MYSHDILIALSTPLIVTKAIHYFFGFIIGQNLLGYAASYPEYCNDEKKTE